LTISPIFDSIYESSGDGRPPPPAPLPKGGMIAQGSELLEKGIS